MSSPEVCTSVLVKSNKKTLHDTSQDEFICNFCEKVFHSSSKIIKHLQNRSLKFTCIKCKISFCTRENIEKHCALNRKCKPLGGKQLLIKKKETETKKDKILYTCKTCNKQLSSKQSLNEHTFIHIPEEKKYHCAKCNKYFATSYRLEEHERSHKITYYCKLCTTHFNRLNNYNAHLRTHNTDKVIMCPVCKKTFKKLGNMKRHLDVHSTEKKYSCKFCSEKFNHSSKLYHHERKHRNDKENLMESDADVSSNRQNLINKENSIESDTDDMSSNSTKSDFEEYVFKCNICKKSFTSKQYLAQHMRIHSNTKSFKCKYCEKSFRLHSTLKQHLNIHEKTNEYRCQFCGKSFDWARSLRRHITSHDKDEEKNQ